MKPCCVVLLLLLNVVHFSSGQSTELQSPDQFLQYPLGSRFTPHYLLVEYFRHAAGASDKIKLVDYGKTYELRPLIAAIISSPQNINRVEEIRQNNLRRTGLQTGNVKEDDIAIVYLSYSIHGNEAAGSESSMAVLYDLIKGSTEIDQWLSNTVVIIDPCLNPDGYSRYSQWNNSVSNIPFNANPESLEHHEPWPGGRTNHYYFDLNRDWAWQTQKESRERIAFYRQWMPHVHADLHEMSGGSSYYFAPAAQPYHPYLTPWQSEFQIEIGKNHASYFDKKGWRYFTKEFFDLFYPSYGDTYPMLSGAIGMTYEQAGSSGAGRALLLGNNDTLKLSDRIAHHHVTSLSTIEVSSRNASRLVKAFADYYKNSVSDPAGRYNYYVIKRSDNSGRIPDLLSLLERNDIRYAMLSEDHKQIKGFSYSAGEEKTFIQQKGDIIIPSAQPKSALLNALFEPEAELVDSLTYDITAWSVPMAYGLNVYATNESMNAVPYKKDQVTSIDFKNSAYAYAIPWGSVASSRLLASILRDDIMARYATEDFEVNAIHYDAGTIVVMRADNRNFPDLDATLEEKFKNAEVPVSAISTGFVHSGKDLGSGSYVPIRIPNVLTVSGKGVSSLGVGQVWHFFEEELQYPVHIIDVQNFNDIDIDHYNVIVLPEGSYMLDNDLVKKMTAWARGGGQVIAIGSAIRQLAGKEGIAIKSKVDFPEENPPLEEPAHFPEAYNTVPRKSMSGEIAGAVFRTHIDPSHPLSFGLGENYWTLKTSPSLYAWLPSGGNAVYLNDQQQHYGFTGSKVLAKINKTLVAGREQMGKGGIVYLTDNPLFRSFWNSGKVLFSNAIFF